MNKDLKADIIKYIETGRLEQTYKLFSVQSFMVDNEIYDIKEIDNKYINQINFIRETKLIESMDAKFLLEREFGWKDGQVKKDNFDPLTIKLVK